MPNSNRSLGVYVKTANPDSVNDTTLYRGGELGVAYDFNDRAYQVVQLDSGVIASTGPGVVAANQLAFWKERAKYLVTNDPAQAKLGGVTNSYANNVAGIFRVAATSGNYVHILQRGRNIAVKEAGSAAGGMSLEATPSATTAGATGVAVGTQNSYQKLGVVHTATAANVCYADVDIPNIP